MTYRLMKCGLRPPGPAPSGIHNSSLHHFIIFPFAGVLISYACAALIFAAGLAAARLVVPGRRLGSPLSRTPPWPPLQSGQTCSGTDIRKRYGGADIAACRHDGCHARAGPGGQCRALGPEIVGKVTGMSNCQWAHPSVAARGGTGLLGRKYPLTAGLLEITYDSGAKVIVQGPAIYSAFSLNAGGLYFGKVTATASKLDRALLSPPKRPGAVCRLRLPWPRFALHTPSCCLPTTATRRPSSASRWTARKRLSRASARARSMSGRRAFTAPYPASAGTCVWTGRGGWHDGLLIFKPGPETAIFATKMPKPPPVCLTQPAANEPRRPAGAGG